MDTFIHVRSPKFTILPGEEEELVNEGMYGKAVAQYLQQKLKDRGYDAPFFVCEDWGWWVEIKGAPIALGVCIYCGPIRDGLLDFFCTDGALSARKWNWRKFGFVDATPVIEKLYADLISIFQSDPEVEVVSTNADSPSVEDDAAQ